MTHVVVRLRPAPRKIYSVSAATNTERHLQMLERSLPAATSAGVYISAGLWRDLVGMMASQSANIQLQTSTGVLLRSE